jgi:hypothetical protein
LHPIEASQKPREDTGEVSSPFTHKFQGTENHAQSKVAHPVDWGLHPDPWWGQGLGDNVQNPLAPRAPSWLDV